MKSLLNRRQFIENASKMTLGIGAILPAKKTLSSAMIQDESQEYEKSDASLIALIGSLRKGGNTDTLVTEMLKAAEGGDLKTDKIYLMDQEIRPCTLCNSCRQHDRPPCIINDDFNQIIQKIQNADTVIFSTPTYWKNVSGLLKLFMERCYSLFDQEWKNPKIGGKHAALVICCGSNDVETNTGPLVNSLEGFLNWCDVSVVDKVVAVALDKGDILKNPEAMNHAVQIGKKLSVIAET